MSELQKPKYSMVGKYGNAFILIEGWRSAARKAGWPDTDIERVVAECQSGDYNNVLRTILLNSQAAMQQLEERGETMEPTPDEYALDAMAVANMREIP